MKLKSLLLCGVMAAALLSSCTTSKTVLPYFTDIMNSPEGSVPDVDYMPIIQPDDELFITVMSEYPDASSAYNLPSVNPATRSDLVGNGQIRSLTYIVDSKGNIDFPMLGTLHVAGMTTEELKDELYEKISKDVKDPVINVQMVNFNVVVAGEVKTPQTIKVERNRISVLDALAKAGDLTEYGERSNILVIREEDGIRKYAHLDLNDSKTLTSPYFYLKQNDYVYVAPNKIRQANSKYNQNNAFKLQVISTIATSVSVITSLIIAFTR